jgi:DNA-binding transcriptional MerR regulator
MDKDRWTLSELAAETGLAARTIRYYIARGLLSGPDVAGRGAFYDRRHVERLREIQELQAQGRMLAEIAQTGSQPDLPEPQAWWQYTLADGVVVSVRGDLAPWRLKHIRAVLAQAAAQLSTQREEHDGTEQF